MWSPSRDSGRRCIVGLRSGFHRHEAPSFSSAWRRLLRFDERRTSRFQARSVAPHGGHPCLSSRQDPARSAAGLRRLPCRRRHPHAGRDSRPCRRLCSTGRTGSPTANAAGTTPTSSPGTRKWIASSPFSPLDDRLAAPEPLGFPPEKLFQDPIADALTHVSRLAMLRRGWL
jgi:hypothetical protein